LRQRNAATLRDIALAPFAGIERVGKCIGPPTIEAYLVKKKGTHVALEGLEQDQELEQ
jgi:hypothetical protein